MATIMNKLRDRMSDEKRAEIELAPVKAKIRDSIESYIVGLIDGSNDFDCKLLVCQARLDLPGIDDIKTPFVSLQQLIALSPDNWGGAWVKNLANHLLDLGFSQTEIAIIPSNNLEEASVTVDLSPSSGERGCTEVAEIKRRIGDISRRREEMIDLFERLEEMINRSISSGFNELVLWKLSDIELFGSTDISLEIIKENSLAGRIRQFLVEQGLINFVKVGTKKCSDSGGKGYYLVLDVAGLKQGLGMK